MAQPNWLRRFAARWRPRPQAPTEAPPAGEQEHQPNDEQPRAGWLTRRPSANERLVVLVDQIQQHLIHQDERSGQIAGSLERLARTLAELPNAERQQNEALATIAAQIEAGNRNTQTLSESLRDVPRLAKLQAETLAGIRTQLERSNNTDSEVSLSLQTFGKALGNLNESTQAQVTTLGKLAGQAEQRDSRLSALLSQQTRRFTMLFAVTLVAALLAVAAVVMVVLLQLFRPPA
jgi:uncharacterized phage infection (PIP) family protein YhgE